MIKTMNKYTESNTNESNNTTTKKLNIYNDFFSSEEEAKKFTYKKIDQTNSRYRDFKQTHFTAGDIEQFEKFRDLTDCSMKHTDVKITDNIFEENGLCERIYESIEWSKNKNISPVDIDNTFNYVFNKFKKGIYVKILDNKLRVFLPFSKHDYINEWGHLMKIEGNSDKKTNFINFFSDICNSQGYKFKPWNVNLNPNKWVGNGALIRYENPLNEGDSGVSHMHDMLIELCKNRKVPDIEFFLNRRDFPIIKKNETEAYEDIFGKDFPLVSHNYEKYCPILGGSKTKEYGDISIPTWDDWQRVNPTKFFPKSVYKSLDVNKIKKWEDKMNIAVFRGASTGRGTTIDDNMRLRVSHLTNSKENIDENCKPYINAGITKWNIRPRKKINSEYLSTIIPVKDYEKEHMNIQEQSYYKYIINIDGHVTAFRLSQELSMGCVILLVKSEYSIWFMNLLEEGVHYISVSSDLSNLFEKVKWCRENDDKCKKIAENAKGFYDKYLSKEGILDYLQIVLFRIRKNMGEYSYGNISPFQIQLKEQEAIQSYSKSKKFVSYLGDLYNNANLKQYGILKGIEKVIEILKMSENLNNYIKIYNPLKQTIKTIISNAKFNNINIIVKSSKSEVNQEYLHESFIGMKGVNELRKKIPNFVYTLGYFYTENNNINIIQEKITGYSLYEYINSKHLFKMDEFIFILIQIMLSLQYAQENIGFVHWDLTPWNIILERHDRNINFNYSFVNCSTFSLKTNIIPVLIDFGNSHIIRDGKHYGNINKYKMTTIQDCISILIKSLKSIVKNTKREESRDILYIINFISGTKYCKDKLKTLEEVYEFLDSKGDYSSLLYLDKFELENKTPIDFINYMMKEERYSKLMENRLSNTNILNTNCLEVYPSYKHVIDYMLSTDKDSRLKSFINVFDRITSSNIYPRNENTLYNYYIAQSMKNNIDSIYCSFIDKEKCKETCKEFSDDERNLFIEKYKSCDNFIYNIFKEANMNSECKVINYDIPEISEYSVYNESDRVFTDKTRMEKLLKGINFKGKDMCKYSLIVIDVFNYNRDIRYVLPKETRDFYYDNFKELFDCKDMIKIKDLEARFNSITSVYTQLKI
jgi:hypothetical protein